jgi:hypothetical protein
MRSHFAINGLFSAIALGVLLSSNVSRAGTIWIEGEDAAIRRTARHSWYSGVKTNELAGGSFVSHWDQEKPGEAEYRFEAPAGGRHEFWVRANPVQSKLSYSLNDGPEVALPVASHQQSINIAADEKPDLRFIAWIRAGELALRPGSNTLRFRMTSDNHHHGMLDCFVLSTEPFRPNGALRPGERPRSTVEPGWFAFDPPDDPFRDSALDLRHLNEKFAGEHGVIAARGDEFVHSSNGAPVRFWAVNGPPESATGVELKKVARRLAKYGVNLVRVHSAMFDRNGNARTNKAARAREIVQAMKAEGIYTHFSIYFPLWMTPSPTNAWLSGYDGKTHPFAALMFNPEFQERYRDWWKLLLLTPDPANGKRLVDDPAVFGLEIQNEDSFFFWTFHPDRIPNAQLRLLETRFGDWLKKRHGSIEAAAKRWPGAVLKRDNFTEGRVAFRPLYNMFTDKTARDRDTVQFLFELQQSFYADVSAFLRSLGFKGVITASNWATASPEVFGPLEKWSYATTDFIDRHGYFSVTHKGESSEWSIRNGHTYSDRSALRFDPSAPGKPKQFVHPAMDPTYDNKPSMISETTWNRPNRFRSEAPLYYAAYGALQGTDAIVHFALDGGRWSVKPGYWMQPWTLMAPSQIGQFPAAALLYRRGLVRTGDVLAHIRLSTNELLQLKGTPLPQDANFDELRLKDVPDGTEVRAGQRIDPLIHYAGRTQVSFGSESSITMSNLAPLVNRAEQMVRSATRELTLDYGKGFLTVNAPAAQGASGDLRKAGRLELQDVVLASPLDNVHCVLVALDGEPIRSSRRMLLQVMSEEKPTGFASVDAGNDVKRITNIGRDPWQVKELQGVFKFKDGREAQFQPLDFNGYPDGTPMRGVELKLRPQTMYYLVTRE